MRVITAAGIALAFTAFQVHADVIDPVVQTQVSLTGLNYTLTDLRPYDLYAPKLNLLSNGNGSYLTATDTATRTGDSIYLEGNLFTSENGRAETPYEGVTLAVKNGRDLSSSVAYGQSTFEGLSAGFFVPANRPGSMGSVANVYTYSSWKLSPYTSLTITGTLSIDQSINGENLVGLAGLQAASDRSLILAGSAGTGLSINGIDGDFTKVLSSAWISVNPGQVVTSAGVTDYAAGNSAHLTKSFSLSVENTTGDYLTLFLSGSTQASFNARVIDSVVPEPGTWALMALGLGLLAWRVRASRRPIAA
jgi:hypothetical protein